MNDLEESLEVTYQRKRMVLPPLPYTATHSPPGPSRSLVKQPSSNPHPPPTSYGPYLTTPFHPVSPTYNTKTRTSGEGKTDPGEPFIHGDLHTSRINQTRMTLTHTSLSSTWQNKQVGPFLHQTASQLDASEPHRPTTARSCTILRILSRFTRLIVNSVQDIRTHPSLPVPRCEGKY